MSNGRIPDGTELTVTGVYDPSFDDNGLISEVGDVYGMQADGNYRKAMSAEFEVYDDTETSIAARTIALFTSRKHKDDWIPDMRYIKDCLDMDAGLRLQDKLSEPDRGHHSGGGGSGTIKGHAVKQPGPVTGPFPQEQPATPNNARRKCRRTTVLCYSEDRSCADRNYRPCDRNDCRSCHVYDTF